MHKRPTSIPSYIILAMIICGTALCDEKLDNLNAIYDSELKKIEEGYRAHLQSVQTSGSLKRKADLRRKSMTLDLIEKYVRGLKAHKSSLLNKSFIYSIDPATGLLSFTAEFQHGTYNTYSQSFDPSSGLYFIYDWTLGDHQAKVFSINADTGASQLVREYGVPFMSWNGPFFSGNSGFFYDHTRPMLKAYRLHGTGVLELLQEINTNTGVYVGIQAIHPSGKFLYASNRGHDSIAVFAIDPKTGNPTPLDRTLTGGKTPRNFNLDPTGRYLLAANQESAAGRPIPDGN